MSIDTVQFTGHTPGPWEWYDGMLRRVKSTVILAPNYEYDEGPSIVTLTSEVDNLLIEKAPDLLAEVVRLRNELNYFDEGQPLSEEDSKALDELGNDVFETKEVKQLRAQLSIASEALKMIRNFGNRSGYQESVFAISSKALDEIKQEQAGES